MDPELPEPGRRHQRLTNGQDTWRARYWEISTPGSAGGPGKPTGSNPGRAPRSDPTSAAFAGLVHQLCTAHILRDLADAGECYPHAHWPTQIANALRDLIHAANTARDAGQDTIDDQLREARLGWIRAGVAVGLSEVDRNPDPKGKQPPGRCLLEALRDRLDDVTRFAHDLRVPPTNNQAERDVRPAKTQQKISGRLTSEAVTRARYRIRGYVSTAAKHGFDQLAALRDAILGHPWTPPARAPA